MDGEYENRATVGGIVLRWIDRDGSYTTFASIAPHEFSSLVDEVVAIIRGKQAKKLCTVNCWVQCGGKNGIVSWIRGNTWAWMNGSVIGEVKMIP